MKVLTIMPRLGAWVAFDAARAFFYPVHPDENEFDQVGTASIASSGGTGNFNSLWCMVRNAWESGDFDHVAMLHSDMGAPAGWVGMLQAERRLAGTNVIAGCPPIKDENGVTSIAVDGGEPYQVSRRLTMREIHDLPETFTEEDVGEPLLMNTGIWLAEMGPWVNEVFFRDVHHFDRGSDGKWRYRKMSEDWDFARQLRQQGVTVAFTRKVPIEHHGEWRWCSKNVWGKETERPVESNGEMRKNAHEMVAV